MAGSYKDNSPYRLYYNRQPSSAGQSEYMCGNGGAVLVKPFSLYPSDRQMPATSTVIPAPKDVTWFPCTTCGFECDRCHFYNNTAFTSGGAIFAELGSMQDVVRGGLSDQIEVDGVNVLAQANTFPTNSIKLSSCVFQHNRVGYSYGCVVWCFVFFLLLLLLLLLFEFFFP